MSSNMKVTDSFIDEDGTLNLTGWYIAECSGFDEDYSHDPAAFQVYYEPAKTIDPNVGCNMSDTDYSDEDLKDFLQHSLNIDEEASKTMINNEASIRSIINSNPDVQMSDEDLERFLRIIKEIAGEDDLDAAYERAMSII